MNKLIYNICALKVNIIQQIKEICSNIISGNNNIKNGDKNDDEDKFISENNSQRGVTVNYLNNIIDEYLNNIDINKYYSILLTNDNIYNIDILFLKIIKFQSILAKIILFTTNNEQLLSNNEQLLSNNEQLLNGLGTMIFKHQQFESLFINSLIKKYYHQSDGSELNNKEKYKIIVNKMISIFRINYNFITNNFNLEKLPDSVSYLILLIVLICKDGKDGKDGKNDAIDIQTQTKFNKILLKFELLYHPKLFGMCLKGGTMNILQYILPLNFSYNSNDIYSPTETVKILFDLKPNNLVRSKEIIENENYEIDKINSIEGMITKLKGLGINIYIIKACPFVLIRINQENNDGNEDSTMTKVTNIAEVYNFNDETSDSQKNIIDTHEQNSNLAIVLFILESKNNKQIDNVKIMICQDRNGNYFMDNKYLKH
jgi:hypothetical protein